MNERDAHGADARDGAARAHRGHEAPTSAHLGASSLERGRRFSHRIGSYAIKEVLGEGGMGLVYLAEQERPRRLVALKVIRPGVVSPEVLGRFAHEVEVLGHLHHPGIAQIFEAGSADTGDGPQPYFVMEYVRGDSLTEYAARHALSVSDRLVLLARVCDAVQHAHQKGVVHRDLKPGNILVEEDATTGEARPKVLDFGIARATNAESASLTLMRDGSKIVGTLSYMSPEQAGCDSSDVDTRSDVYSLGVIAYELLAGEVPHRVRDRSLVEAVRVIVEEEPMPLGSIQPRFRGDIECIVRKALEKDRDRRYQTASALADDVRRHLAGEPVVARPPSATYQLRKFARRNRALVGGVLGVLVASTAGTVVSVRFALDASASAAASLAAKMDAEEREAEAIAARTAEEAAREEEARQRRIAESVNGFMNDDFVGLIDPEVGLGRATTVLELVRRASTTIGDRFEGEPEVEAQVRLTIGRAFGRLGLVAEAMEHLDRALEIRTDLYGRRSLESAEVLRAMAATLERDDIDRAISLAEEVVSISESRLDPGDGQVAIDQGDLAMYRGVRHLRDTGEFLPGASPILLQMLAGVRGRGETSEEVSRDIWATLLRVDRAWEAGDRRGADEELETMVAPFLASPVLADRVPYTLAGIGAALIRLDRAPGAAECLLRWAIERGGEALGEDHPHTLAAVVNLGVLLRERGRLDEAEPLLRRAVSGFGSALGDEHPNTLLSMAELALLYDRQGRADACRGLMRERLEIQRRTLGDGHPDTLVSLFNLGAFLVRAGDFAAAEPVAVECYEGNVARYGEGHHETRDAVELLVYLYATWQEVEPNAGHGADAELWRRRFSESP